MEVYFDGDRPIEAPTDDRLGRAEFVHSLARLAFDRPVNHGYTVAVTGPWGCGKTSILNLMRMNAKTRSDITVLDFNPWLFAGAPDLVAKFFEQIGSQAGRNSRKTIRKVGLELSRLGRMVSQESPIPGSAAAANVGTQYLEDWMRPPTLDEERDGLRTALRKAKKRFVVLVDDIDRLHSYELNELFRALRLISGLPNVVFVLAYDREHAAASLSSPQESGQGYLDKIVQVPIEVPAAHGKLADILLDELQILFSDYTYNPEPDRWARLYLDLISPQIATLRDLKRLLNTLPVQYEMIGQEVDLLDLISIESIRILSPEVFQKLKDHRSYLVRTSALSVNDIAAEQKRSVLTELIANSKDRTAITEAALELLFPATQESLGRTTYGPNWESTWRRLRRLANEEILDIYMQSSLPEGSISTPEVRSLMSVMEDAESFSTALSSLSGSELEIALERLTDYEGQFSIAAAEASLPVVLQQMGRLADNSPGFFRIAPRMKASRLALRLLRAFSDPGETASLVERIWPRLKTLSAKLELTEMIGHRESVGHQLVGEDAASLFEQRLIDEFCETAPAELADEWDLISLVIRVPRWFEDQQFSRAQDALRNALVVDEYVLALLTQARTPVYHSEGTTWRLFWEPLEELFTHTSLTEAIERVAKSTHLQQASDDTRHAVELAQRYASGWRPSEWPHLDTG